MDPPPPPPPPPPLPPPPPPPTTSTNIEVMDLSTESQARRAEHESLLLNLEAKKRAFEIDVPTLPNDVKIALRNIGEPVRLFGENLADVRDRLRMCLARIEVLKDGGGVKVAPALEKLEEEAKEEKVEEGEEVTKYTHASSELIEAREEITIYSLQKAKERLMKERRRRMGAAERVRKRKNVKRACTTTTTSSDHDNAKPNKEEEEEEDEEEANIMKKAALELDELDDTCLNLYKSIRSMALEGSQYGDTRPLSAICTSRGVGGGGGGGVSSGSNLVATGGWSGTIKLWDGKSDTLDCLGSKGMAHEDRIMGIAMRPKLNYGEDGSGGGGEDEMVATASIDLTAKLWHVRRNDYDEAMDEDDDDFKSKNQSSYTITEAAHLKGHKARLCSVTFHPMGRHVATTSFDHTWRMWDVETGSQLLLQDGHYRETYGIGMHPDGSLCSTTDFGGVVQVWDLRSGKSACHFLGHAKRVISSEFNPNGFQLATAGDDGTIKIWDLRRRKQFASIPAHTKLITQLRFAHNDENGQNGEFLVSCSFDGTAKTWSTRDWKMLSTLRGHEGKVMGIDVLGGGGGDGVRVVTSGYDKTLKLWK